MEQTLERRVNEMIRKICIVPDVHMDVTVPRPYETVKRFIKKNKFDEIVLLGDFMDVSSLSAWDMDKKLLMEGRRFSQEVDLANKELDYLQKYCKKITYLEGNHEDRVGRYIERHSELEGTLDLPKVLKLKERGIKWVKYNDLYKVGKLYMTHGCYTNKYYAQKTLDMFGCNVVVGHVHRPQKAFTTAKMTDSKMCWGLGCLCGKEPDYMRGRPSSWENGFAVAYIEDSSGKFSMYPIEMSRTGSFIWDGKVQR